MKSVCNELMTKKIFSLYIDEVIEIMVVERGGFNDNDDNFKGFDDKEETMKLMSNFCIMINNGLFLLQRRILVV